MIRNSFYSSASYQSFWKGYWYYKNGNVLSWKKVNDYEYEGIVKSDNQKDQYNVVINLKKPRASKCNCPFAEGTYKVCKHMVALYFTVFPEEFVAFEKELEEERKLEEERIKQREIELKKREKELRKEITKWPKKKLVEYVLNDMLYSENDGEDYYSDECYW